MIYKAFALILDSVCGVVYKKGDIMPKNYLLILSVSKHHSLAGVFNGTFARLFSLCIIPMER